MSTAVSNRKTTKTMRAAVLTDPGRVTLGSIAVPPPGPWEVRVRLEGCGVCGSNLEPYLGREWFNYPFEPGAPGHEGWGVVDAIGNEVAGFKAGERVGLMSFHAFAEYDVAHADSVVKLPPSLDNQAFPAEPLACAMNIARRAAFRHGETVAIIGIGFQGALLTRLATEAGARVIAISRREYALKQALQSGAEACIVMDDHWRIIEQVKELSGGGFCDCVIEATGTQWPLDVAGELVKERGRLVVAGYHQDGPRQVNMQLWNWRGIDVINAHERDPHVYTRGMHEAVEAVCAGKIKLQPLLTHQFKLEELPKAFEMLKQRPDGFMKGIVCYDH